MRTEAHPGLKARLHALLASDAAPVLLVLAAMSFNFLLAILNANGREATGGQVQLVQLTITALALGLIAVRGRPHVQFAFPLLLGAYIFFFVVTGFLTGGYNIKALYDVVLLASFIALGATVGRLEIRALNWLIGIAAAVALFELFLPGTYANFVDPFSYFANTREWVAEATSDVFSDGAALSINGTRGGGESWLGITGNGHRVGGIFLEPLSQGYFAVIASIIYSVAYQNRLRARTIATIVCLLLAAVSDTRAASMLIIAFYLLTPVFRRLPIGFAALVPFLGLALAFVGYLLIMGDIQDSEFAFRLSLTFGVIAQTPLYITLFGGIDTTHAADSGIVTLLAYSGIGGTIVFFLMSAGWASSQTRAALPAILVAIYLIVTALFGGAFFSIKTAALLGLVIGAAGSGAFSALPPKPRRIAVRRSAAAVSA